MTGSPSSVVLTVAPVPPMWFLLLVLGLLFGPPIAGMVYGVLANRPDGMDYVLAGGISLGFVAIWALGTLTLAALFGDLLQFVVMVTSVVVPAAHVYWRYDREGDGVLGLAAIYAPPLLLVVFGAVFWL